jgi:hypothetical protein
MCLTILRYLHFEAKVNSCSDDYKLKDLLPRKDIRPLYWQATNQLLIPFVTDQNVTGTAILVKFLARNNLRSKITMF